MEWICCAADDGSLIAALHLGFRYEGVRRQHRVLTGNRNSDDCILAIVDHEWLGLSNAYERHLSDASVANNGHMVQRLSE